MVLAMALPLHDLQLVMELNPTDLDPDLDLAVVPRVNSRVKVAEVEVDLAKLTDEAASASVIIINTTRLLL